MHVGRCALKEEREPRKGWFACGLQRSIRSYHDPREYIIPAEENRLLGFRGTVGMSWKLVWTLAFLPLSATRIVGTSSRRPGQKVSKPNDLPEIADGHPSLTHAGNSRFEVRLLGLLAFPRMHINPRTEHPGASRRCTNHPSLRAALRLSTCEQLIRPERTARARRVRSER